MALKYEKFLGEGTFGSVSLVTYTRSSDGKTNYAALKTSNKSLHKEFQILSEFKDCSRIIQCHRSGVQETINEDGDVEYHLPMEYAAGGSLKSFMDRFKDGKLPERMIIRFTRMLLEGLATIHGRGYIHCDLKPENILLCPIFKNGSYTISSYDLKISDFGLTRKEGDYTWWYPRKPYAGTPIYMSPESVSHGETGQGLDLWSLGCVVLEMFTGKKPWWHTNYDLKDLKKCYEPLIPDDLPRYAKYFIGTCFAIDPDGRYDALRLLEHNFLREEQVNNQLTNVKIDDNPTDESDEQLEKIIQMLHDIMG